MASANKDRERLREDLRALAKLANPGPTAGPTPAPPPSQHGFATADSSGFVDLSKFSATDDRWVEKELARSRAVSKPTPPSIRPVSVDDIVVEVEDAAPAKTKKRGGWIGTSLGLLGACAVAALAFTMARHPPRIAPKTVPETPVAAAAPAPPPPVSETASPQPIAPSAEAAPAPTPSAAPSAVVATTDPGKAKRANARAVPVATPRPAAAPVAAAPPPPKPIVANVPPPKAGSGDPLMDAIRASVTGKKK